MAQYVQQCTYILGIIHYNFKCDQCFFFIKHLISIVTLSIKSLGIEKKEIISSDIQLQRPFRLRFLIFQNNIVQIFCFSWLTVKIQLLVNYCFEVMAYDHYQVIDISLSFKCKNINKFKTPKDMSSLKIRMKKIIWETFYLPFIYMIII